MIYVIAEWPRKLYSSFLVYVKAQWKWMIGENMIYPISLFWDMDCKRWFIPAVIEHIFHPNKEGGCVRMGMSHLLIFLACNATVKELQKGHSFPAGCFYSLNYFKLLHVWIPHSWSDVSVAHHLTFIPMMSVTQLTCASSFSQHKCLRRKCLLTSVTEFLLVIFTIILNRWLDLASHCTGRSLFWGDSSLITVNWLDDRWAGCH